MSWGLIATAAAGLNAGAGLHCLLVESYPSGSTDLALSDSYWHVFKATTASKLTFSSGFGALAAAAGLGAYLAGGENADPAWITCALVSAVIPLYNALVLAPTASVVTNSVMDTQPPKERESWLASFGRKSMVSTGFAVAAFGCMLLVVGGSQEGNGLAMGGTPLRFR